MESRHDAQFAGTTTVSQATIDENRHVCETVESHVLLNPVFMPWLSHITVSGERIEFVASFRHLGTIHSASGSTDEDQAEKVAKARGKYFSLAALWDHKQYSPRLKAAIFLAVIVPILLAGIATSPDPANRDDALSRFYYRCLKIMSGKQDQFSYDEDGEFIEVIRYSKEDVLRTCGAPTFEALRERERLNLLGIVHRSPLDSPLKSIEFGDLVCPDHPDSHRLWYGRALAAVKKLQINGAQIHISEALNKTRWTLATAALVEQSKLDPRARHALSPQRALVDQMDDNDLPEFDRNEQMRLEAVWEYFATSS
jgi:hypothetical protein